MSQSVDCLLSMHKAQDSIPAQHKPGVVLAICNLSTHEAERGARGLRHPSVESSNTLTYRRPHLRGGRATRDLELEEKPKKQV